MKLYFHEAIQKVKIHMAVLVRWSILVDDQVLSSLISNEIRLYEKEKSD